MRTLRQIVTTWSAWAACLLVLQAAAPVRFQIAKPDTLFSWTRESTGKEPQPVMRDSFLAGHKAWDSAFFLSIATAGYDDPAMPGVRVPPGIALARDGWLSASYNFMPGYPLAIRVVAVPLRAGLGPVAAATLAGIAISLASTLLALLALARLARPTLGDDGAYRAACYLLVFPTGFFLAQVYSEGLFLALLLWSMVHARDGRPLLAGVLAGFATTVRFVGVLGVIPILWPALAAGSGLRRQDAVRAMAGALLPLAVFMVWWFSPLGEAFRAAAGGYFRRDVLALEPTVRNLVADLRPLVRGPWPVRLQRALEVAALGLAGLASLASARSAPPLAVHGVASLAVSLSNGYLISTPRYVLAIPVVFLFLARRGEHPVVDRVWTMASTILMSVLLILFTFDYWVA